MVGLSSLVVPIVVSSVAAFVVSSVIHMVLPYHKSDYQALPSEASTLDALRKIGIPPGEYLFPRPQGMADMKSQAFQDKMAQGPVGMLTVRPPGPMAMGGPLLQWFVFCLVVGVFSAYVAGRVLAPGAHFAAAFRYTGTVAFAAYGVGRIPESVWMWRKWSTTIKHMFDGVLLALATGLVFGWLWPR